MLDKLTIADFEPRIGETFSARASEGRPLALTLTGVAGRHAPPGGGRAPFSLEFRDRRADHVPQQTVAVEHPELGAFELFVVPLGPGPEGMRYEAVFT